jgi:hypothetical protein
MLNQYWQCLIINWLFNQSNLFDIVYITPVICPILDLEKESFYTSLLFLTTALVGQWSVIIK